MIHKGTYGNWDRDWADIGYTKEMSEYFLLFMVTQVLAWDRGYETATKSYMGGAYG
jgi:hypothetical protein